MDKRTTFKTMLMACVFTGLATQTLAADKGVITMCGTTWGKLGGEHLPGKGLVPDFVSRVFEHAGYKTETYIVPWPRCVEEAKKQKFDLVASAWRGENFDPFFDYMDVIFLDTINFIVPEDSAYTSGEIKSFYGKKVGIVREAGGLEEILKDHDDIKVQAVALLSKLPPMLFGGRFDAIISDPVSLYEQMKSIESTKGKKVRALQPPLKANLQSPLIAKGHPRKEQLTRDFAKALKEMTQNGLYEEMEKIHDTKIQRP
ncbi:transporter substrate-binding domain-containing protein [Terasakiella sp. A23]|uniref:substrate-binding periplasmic protein n=1 Tax=Terasakiella sp. FCG-A23 TaxID=3080561 RepID=UPI002953B529|nr:transporter substrate-binding domain-containing protein [Terasakiella sp. A23]MDV7338913.1 transporter substrate-binding domain-containing protein [Terasakiella sp. A23]